MIKNAYPTLPVLTVLVVGALLLAACAPALMPMTVIEESHNNELALQETHRESSAPIEGAPEIRIVATEFSFEPATIRLSAGEAVNIVLVNEGAVEHEVEFGDFGLHLHAEPGETVTGGLVPQTTGEFEFGCFIPGHYEAGMRGEAHVEQAHE